MKLQRTSHAQINSIIERFEKEPNLYTKVKIMIDLFEVIIKTHTAAIIGMYLDSKKLSSSVRAFLAEGLVNTPLGSWQLMSRIIMNEFTAKVELSADEYKAIMEGLSEEKAKILNKYYNRQRDKYVLSKESIKGFRKEENELFNIFKKLNYKYSEELPLKDFYSYFFKFDETIEKKRVVNFRNKYAHGATCHKDICRCDIEEHIETLDKMLRAPFINNTYTVSFMGEEEIKLAEVEGCDLGNILGSRLEEIKRKNIIVKDRLYLLTEENTLIDLYPIMILDNNSTRCSPYINGNSNSTNMNLIVFLNNINKLNSGSGEAAYLHYSTGNHIKKDNIYKEFTSRIDIPRWKENISDEFKYLVKELTGNYIGRTSEINDIKSFVAEKSSGYYLWFGVPGIGKSALIARTYSELNSDKNSNMYAIAYYIKSVESSKKIDSLLDYLHKELDKINSSTLVPRGSEIEEKSENLTKKLRYFSESLNDKKLVIFIDGLDEGVDADLLKYIPSEIFKNIIFVMTSRKIAEVEKFYLRLPEAYKDTRSLKGLESEDIRAILYEVVNKYELSDYHVETIKEKSQGNPLYIKLLCMELEDGRLSLNNLNALPLRLEDFYKGIMKHFYEKKIDKLIPALYTIAAAADYVTQQHVKYILKVDDCTSKEILDVLGEILVEHPQKRRCYQLFHESFREYLKAESEANILEGHHNLVEFCRQWKNSSIYGNELRKYMFQYYSTHLYKLGMKEEIYKLINDSDYWREQLEATGEYADVYRLYHDAALIANTCRDEEMMIKAAVKISTLNEVILEDENNFYKYYNSDLKLYVKKELSRIRLLKGTELIIQFFKILYNIISKGNTADSLKRELTNKVIEEFDKIVLRDINRGNLATVISLRLLVEITVELYKLGANAEPIMDRIGPTSKFDNYDKQYLADVYIEPKDEFYEKVINKIIEPLRTRELLAEQIVTGFALRKEISEAMNFIDELDDVSIKDQCYKLVAVLAYKKGYILKAYEINNIMYRINHPNMRSQLLEEVTVIAFEKGYYSGRRFFERIGNISNRSKAGLRISKVLYDKRDFKTSKEYIDNAYYSVMDMTNFKNKVYILIDFSREFIRQGTMNKALEAVDTASAINFEINMCDKESFSPGLYAEIYEVYKLLHKEDKQMEILNFLYENMEKSVEGLKDRISSAVIYCLLKDNNFDMAINKCEELESDLIRGSMLKYISERLCNINRNDEAINLFHKINSRRTAKYLSYTIMESLVEDDKIDEALRFVKVIHGTNVFQMKNLLNLLYKKEIEKQHMYKLFNTAPLPGKVFFKDKKQKAYYGIALQLINEKRYEKARECIRLVQDKRMAREAALRIEQKCICTEDYKKIVKDFLHEMYNYIGSFELLEDFISFISLRRSQQFRAEIKTWNEENIGELYNNLDDYYDNEYLKFSSDYAEFTDNYVDQAAVRSKLYSKFIGNLDVFLKEQKEIFIFLLPHILNNHGAIRSLLGKYALYIRFMSDYDISTVNSLIERINELEDVSHLIINNDQWCYSNFDSWIDKISSSYDRECIEGFKKRVDEGTLTVEKFESRIAGIIDDYR